MPTTKDVETWVVSGKEVEILNVLERIAGENPEIKFKWEVQTQESLVSRSVQRNVSVVDIIVTAVLTKSGEILLDLAYNKMKELLKPKKATARKKRKSKSTKP